MLFWEKEEEEEEEENEGGGRGGGEGVEECVLSSIIASDRLKVLSFGESMA